MVPAHDGADSGEPVYAVDRRDRKFCTEAEAEVGLRGEQVSWCCRASRDAQAHIDVSVLISCCLDRGVDECVEMGEVAIAVPRESDAPRRKWRLEDPLGILRV